MYRMYKCLKFKIEFPFEQSSIVCEYNIKCLLCPRNEKIGSNVKKEKEYFSIKVRNNMIVKITK